MSVGEENSGALDGGSVGRRRHRWSEAQTCQIVAETQEPEVSVLMVTQRYNPYANQIFWRRLFRDLERAGGVGRLWSRGHQATRRELRRRALSPTMTSR